MATRVRSGGTTKGRGGAKGAATKGAATKGAATNAPATGATSATQGGAPGVDVVERAPRRSRGAASPSAPRPPAAGSKRRGVVDVRADKPRALDAIAWRPLFPEPAIDQGDPYVLRVPDGVPAPYRYYAFTTGDGGSKSGMFPVHASNDLATWTKIDGNAFPDADMKQHHWAPCVRYVPGLPRPYVMLFSHSDGEDMDVGHKIFRADAERPEGPYVKSGHVLTPDMPFAIDADVYEEGGKTMLAIATDFLDGATEGARIGTGLAVAEVSADLTTLQSQWRVLGRAQHDWQVYQPRRMVPFKDIPGVDTGTTPVKWHCMEGASGGLQSPSGKDVVLYSGGCYFGFYAVGAIVDGKDVAADGKTFTLHLDEDAKIYAPGHCSTTVGPDGETYIVFHARFGSEDAPRQAALARIEWDGDVPVVRGPLVKR